jgi:predicted nucleic acid-binding protein
LLEVLPPPAQLVLPVVTIGEYLYGASIARQRALNEAWLQDLIRRIRVAPITVETATHYASIRSSLRKKGKTIPANDMWIAALALQHGLPVLSRDAHFDVVDGLTRVAW